MGQVYLAEQISLKRKVAIKIMRPDLAVSPISFQRFRAEAEAVARISHANIVQVYAFGEEAGRHFMALEYVEGRNLRDYLSKKGTVDVPLALSIVRQVAAALDRAAELGIIHRDIKPENILLTRRGEVKVADFGLSRCFGGEQPAVNLTQSGIALGTPLYMSPEQVQGQPVDPRTDIYSLGVTCYHMLAGQPPFRGQSAFELATQHVNKEPPPLGAARPDLPRELCAIVHKMMAKDRNKRYSSCAEVLRDLAQLDEGQFNRDAERGGINSLAGSSLLSSVLSALGSTRSLAVLASLSILMALLAGGALAWKNARPPKSSEASEPPPVTEPLLSEQEKHEKFLKDAVAEYDDPGSDRERLDQGLRFRRDLGLFYLKADRLADAAQFFNDLTQCRVEAYKTLGQLGQAIVLSRQDRPNESDQVFLELVRGKSMSNGRPGHLRVLYEQPQLPYEIAQALNRNKANASAQHPFPAELESLRQAPKRSNLPLNR